MCNLVDAFMEEQYQDPEFLAWLEQKNKQMRDQMEDHYNSIEYARDAIAAEMNNQLMGYTDCDDSISSYIQSKELITELFKDAIANEEREYKSISEWEI